MPPRTVYRPPAVRVNGNEPPRGRVHPTGAPNKAVERATRFTISNTGSSKHASSSLNEDGSINFEYILTPSRSSGVDKGGDMLKDWKIQEDYWVFIQDKINAYWDKYPEHPRDTDRLIQSDKQKADVEENILILLRKLREGISSSRRIDAFAIRIYEQSLFLSLIFSNPTQTTAILPYLLPKASLHTPPDEYKGRHLTASNTNPCVLVFALLHALNVHYPSQVAYYDLLKSIDYSSVSAQNGTSSNPTPGIARVSQIARSLHRGHFTEFNTLTQMEAMNSLLESLLQSVPIQEDSKPTKYTDRELVSKALLALASDLRRKMRISAWKVLKSAYPQFDLGSSQSMSEKQGGGGSEGEKTRSFLVRMLALEWKGPSKERDVVLGLEVERWFFDREKVGEVQRAGPNPSGTMVEGRWIVKIRR